MNTIEFIAANGATARHLTWLNQLAIIAGCITFAGIALKGMKNASIKSRDGVVLTARGAMSASQGRLR